MKANDVTAVSSDDFVKKVKDTVGNFLESDVAVHEDSKLSNVSAVSAEVFHRMVKKLVDENQPIILDKPHGNSKEIKKHKL